MGHEASCLRRRPFKPRPTCKPDPARRGGRRPCFGACSGGGQACGGSGFRTTATLGIGNRDSETSAHHEAGPNFWGTGYDADTHFHAEAGQSRCTARTFLLPARCGDRCGAPGTCRFTPSCGSAESNVRMISSGGVSGLRSPLRVVVHPQVRQPSGWCAKKTCPHARRAGRRIGVFRSLQVQDRREFGRC